MSIIYQFAKNSETDYFNIVDQILKYLASSLEKNITFGRESKLNLIKYLDLYQEGDHTTK